MRFLFPLAHLRALARDHNTRQTHITRANHGCRQPQCNPTSPLRYKGSRGRDHRNILFPFGKRFNPSASQTHTHRATVNIHGLSNNNNNNNNDVNITTIARTTLGTRVDLAKTTAILLDWLRNWLCVSFVSHRNTHGCQYSVRM